MSIIINLMGDDAADPLIYGMKPNERRAYHAAMDQIANTKSVSQAN